MTNNGLVDGQVHNLLVQLFTLDSSKIEVFELCFYDIVSTQYDHPRYVKHVLGRIYMFLTLFGYRRHGGWGGVGGGGSQGIGTQPAFSDFRSGQLKNRSLRTLLFWYCDHQNDHPTYVKHVLGRIYVFFTLFGVGPGGGGERLGISKIADLEIYFFDTMIT